MMVTPMSNHAQQGEAEDTPAEEYKSNAAEIMPRPAPQPTMPTMIMPAVSSHQHNNHTAPHYHALTRNVSSNIYDSSFGSTQIPAAPPNRILLSTMTTTKSLKIPQDQQVDDVSSAAYKHNNKYNYYKNNDNRHYLIPDAFHSSSSVSSDTWNLQQEEPCLLHNHSSSGQGQGQQDTLLCPWQQEARRLRIILKDLGLSSLLSTVPDDDFSNPSASNGYHGGHDRDGWDRNQHWNSLLEEYQSLQECNQSLQSQLEAQVQYYEQMHQDLLMKQARQHGEYQQELRTLGQELEQKRVQVAALTKGHGDMESMLKNMEQRMEYSNDEKYQIMQEMEACRKQNQSHHEKILELQMVSAKYHVDCKELEQRVHDLEQERDRLEAIWREERDRVRGLEEDLGRLRLKDEKTEINVCKLVREKAHLVTKLNEAHARLERKMKTTVNTTGMTTMTSSMMMMRESQKMHTEQSEVKKETTYNGCGGGVGIQWQERQNQVEHSLRQLEKMSMVRNDSHSSTHGGSGSSADPTIVKNATVSIDAIDQENNDPQTSLCSLQELDNDSLSFLEPLSLHNGHGEQEGDEHEKTLNHPNFDYVLADDDVSRSLF